MTISVEVSLYGSLAHLGGGKHLATLMVELQSNACMQDLFDQLKINPEKTSYIFINAVLCDVPGLNASNREHLHDGDHIGIFSLGYMWPYQYRHGMPMTKSLEKAMGEYGTLHHTYTKKEN
jgi:hypothetical protein